MGNNHWVENRNHRGQLLFPKHCGEQKALILKCYRLRKIHLLWQPKTFKSTTNGIFFFLILEKWTWHFEKECGSKVRESEYRIFQ